MLPLGAPRYDALRRTQGHFCDMLPNNHEKTKAISN